MHCTPIRCVINNCVRSNKTTRYFFKEIKNSHLLNICAFYSRYNFNERKSLQAKTSFNKEKTSNLNRDDDNLVAYDDPDTFGLVGRSNVLPDVEDEGDKAEEEFTSNLPLHKDKLPMQKYIDMIKLHVANNRIKEAIDILEVRMLVEDRVKPDSFIYNLLIGSCAQVGYTDKAFKLFNQMKRRGLNVSGGVYTSLFNACANSPWKSDGIQRANKLRQLMNEKSISPNTTNFNSMIKAYGRCGDIKTAFSIVDEMVQLKVPLRVNTLNFLLHACITDKESGFRNALFTWRRMIALKEKPNIYSFNLLIRCIRECGFGNNENNDIIIKDLLGIAPYKKSNLMLNQKEPEIISIFSNKLDTEESHGNALVTSHPMPISQSLPNFLERYPEMDDGVGFGTVKTVNDRFLMVGGVEGILKEMNLYKVVPNLKTVSLLLDVMPNTLENENKLMEAVKLLKIKTDIDFYNILMKRRCFRLDYQAAKDVLNLIDEENKRRKKKGRFIRSRKHIKKDIMTYGVLSLCYETKESAEEFVQMLTANNVRMNAQIAGGLLRQGLNRRDFEYVQYVMDLVKEKDVQVNPMFIEHLQKTMNDCQERQAKNNPKRFTNFHEKFINHFNKWMNMLNKFKLEEPEHPWEQFRVNLPQGFQRFRDHVEFKKKIYKKRNMRPPRYEAKH